MDTQSKPLRLVHITTVPETLNFLTGQIGFMKDRGFEVFCISSPGDVLSRFAERERVRAYAVDMPRRITPLRDLSALREIRRALREIRPAIVHAYTPKGGLLGTLAARLERVPVRIYHILGLPLLTATGHRRVILRWSEMVACRMASQVLCVSRSVRAAAISECLCPESKIRVIHNGSINGVDADERFNPARWEEDASHLPPNPLPMREGESKLPSPVREGESKLPSPVREGESKLPSPVREGESKLPSPVRGGVGGEVFSETTLQGPSRASIRTDYGIPRDAPVVGFVGRLVREKGLAELVEAYEALRAEFPTLRLLVVGDFEPHDPLPAGTVRNLRSGGGIVLAPRRWDIPPPYAAMDVLALPTYREGFPQVPLEAAAMTLPIVATLVPGCLDAVLDGVTGTLVPPRDAHSLTRAIRSYLTDADLRSRHGRAGRERALRDFRQEDVWEGVIEEYRRLLAEKGIESVKPVGVRQRAAGRR